MPELYDANKGWRIEVREEPAILPHSKAVAVWRGEPAGRRRFRRAGRDHREGALEPTAVRALDALAADVLV
ncbi:hypothetical protein [Nocardia sp. NPDC059691]|uniref:hypothetical protein n=1 Tax=Nocardia sp. NPDC059691 TaxID=3346908 RepID=UPI00369D1B80